MGFGSENGGGGGINDSVGVGEGEGVRVGVGASEILPAPKSASGTIASSAVESIGNSVRAWK